MRDGKEVKSTSAHPIDTRTFVYSAKMQLYARVKRSGAVFVSEDPAETLLTELILVADDPAEREAAPVASAQFDIGTYLHHIVQSSSKSLTTDLSFTAGTTVGTTLTIKALGENNLTPYEEPTIREDDPHASQELDKLKTDIREKEVKLDALTAATDRIDKAVQETSKLAASAIQAGDAAALRARITALEEQNQALERDRAEAERKVTAHVAHAAKIKSTYNQLAGWYNNLRNEHVELQKKLSTSDSTIEERKDLPAGVATTHEADIKNLEKERDELQALLQRERTEKKDIYSRNSELLENKARTLAELAEQWEAAKATLTEKQASLDEQIRAVKTLQATVDNLKSELAERDSKLEEQAEALISANNQAKELQSKHAEDLSQIKAQLQRDSEVVLEREVEQIRSRYEEDVARRVEDVEAAYNGTIEDKLSFLRAEHEDELARLRKENTDLVAKHAAELEEIQKEHQYTINVKHEQSEKSVIDAQDTVKSLEAKLTTIQGEKNDLEQKVSELTQMVEERGNESENALRRAAEKHQVEIETIQRAKKNLEKDLAAMKERAVTTEQEVTETREVAANGHAAIKEELESVQAELESLRKANKDLQNSPRDIAAIQNETSDAALELEAEVTRVRSLLKTETEKKDEIARLLAAADSEHDELRDMVTRLRSERDEALRDLREAKNGVSNSRVNNDAVQRGTLATSKGELGSLLEERDKAIRELFRVRKNMKKDIERLKRENIELNQQLSENTGAQNSKFDPADYVSRADHDRALSELQKLRDALFPHEDNDVSELSPSTSKNDISSQILSTLAGLRAEIEIYKTQNLELEKTSEEAARKHSEETQKLIRERDNLLQEIDVLRKNLDSSAVRLQEKDNDLVLLSAKVEFSAQEMTGLSQKWKEAIHQREDAEAKAMALTTELDSLRESLRQAESSNPSLENDLQKAQRQYAEAKAALNLLQVRYNELSQNAEATKETSEVEIARLESVVEDQTSLSNDLSCKLRENEQNQKVRSQEQARLAAELESRDKDVEEVKLLVQKLKSRNASLTAKLAGEKKLRESTQGHLEEATNKVENLERRLESMHVTVQKHAEAENQLQAQCDQAGVALSETKKHWDAAKSHLSEKKAELDDARAKLQHLEESYEVLQREANVADGKSQAASEELTALRAELMQSQSDLQRALENHNGEMEKGSARIEMEHKRVLELEKENSSLVSKHTALESKLRATGNELRSLKESYNTLESQLQEAQRRSKSLDRIISKKTKECDALREEVGSRGTTDEESKTNYENLTNQYKQVKLDLSKAKEEIIVLRENKELDSNKIEVLEQEFAELHGRIALVQEASEEAAAAASTNADKDAHKIADMRKELRSATSMIDALQDEIDRLRESNMKLKREVESWKERADDRDSEVLNDLINTRMELAYSQEETIRLRNKLKKLVQSGQASSSFER